jgi:hypothetical protein
MSSLVLGVFLASVRRCRPSIPVVERGAGVPLVVVAILGLTNSSTILNSYAFSLTPA